MRSKTTQLRTALLSLAILTMLLCAAADTSAQALPKPQLTFVGTEQYGAGGKQFMRYKLALLNRAAYADELFAPAPDLPPCGRNRNSARTWVDIYNRAGRKKINTFCALPGPKELGYLWFAVEKGMPPPASVYITIYDRSKNLRAASNVVTIP